MVDARCCVTGSAPCGDQLVGRGRGRGAGWPCARRTSARASWVESRVEVSLTGTSHQRLGVRGADQRVRLDVDHRAASATPSRPGSRRRARPGARPGPPARRGSPRWRRGRRAACSPSSRPDFGAVAVAGAEPLRAQRLRERADRGEAVVLHQHHDDLEALLDRGDQLGRHHQVGPVADHDEHVAVRAGQPDAEPAGDLVAHAGVAVLDVVALRVPDLPQLVQVTGHRAGGAHDDVARVGEVVDQAEHLALGEQPLRRLAPRRGTPRRRSASHAASSSVYSRDVRRVDAVAVQQLGQRRRASPARRRRTASAGVLDRVDRCDVDVDEPHVGVLRRRCGWPS